MSVEETTVTLRTHDLNNKVSGETTVRSARVPGEA